MKKLQETFRADSRYKNLLAAIITTGLSYGIYKGVLDNYLAEIVVMTEFDRGVAEFFREIPGLMLVFLTAVLYTFSAEKMYKIGAVIMVIGMALHAVLPAEKALLILAIWVYSFGEHIQIGMKSTLSLEYSREGRGGSALGFQSSSEEIGKLLGYLVVVVSFFFIAGKQPFRMFFAVSTGLLLIAMIVAFGLNTDSGVDKPKSRFYFRKKFKKYYMLEVFYGASKQVFFTFGPYVLILFYGAETQIVSLLFAVSSTACFLLAPVVGRIIDRLGYKIVMISDTLILVIVCFFYGFAHHIFPKNVAFIVCCVNYILDSVISLAAMASSVYVQDIADGPEEVKATLSTGVSVNHLITVLIALFGGWIWQKLGIEVLFILSAVLGLCNSAYAATIKKSDRQE